MPRILPMKLSHCLKTLMLLGIISCESQNRRLAEYFERSAQQQARQNERAAQQAEAVARQSQELTSAAHELVTQDAAARREILQAQDRLQNQNQFERSILDRQRELIERERAAQATAAVRDPILAEAIVTGGLMIAAALPLLVTLYALRRLPAQRPVDLLLDNLLENESASRRLPAPNSQAEPPALPDAPPPF